MPKAKLIIIGAGLSGLYSAFLLQKDYDITIIEARERLGGRIYTYQGHDMGPSWVWTHQEHVIRLIKSFGLNLFRQYDQGHALYDVPDGVQRFQAPPSPASYRLQGGVVTLITALSSQLEQCQIRLSESVSHLQYLSSGIRITTARQSYDADYVLCTLPPRLASQNISYNPPLPPQIRAQLDAIPTWMGYARKCVITFKTQFWRDMGLSGFAFSHVGPLSEIHDACTQTSAALFGFAHPNEVIEDFTLRVKAQVARLFGPSYANEIITIHTVDWREEIYSSVNSDHHPLRSHPQYGHNICYFDKKVYFGGTESANDNGGYLEGAVISAETMAKIFKSIKNEG